MKVLGIDWGERRVGLAISPDGQWAFPWKILDVRGFTHAIESLQQVVASENIERIVLGLPVGMDGKDTPQTSRVREVAADLQNIFGIPVELLDERLTSVEATKRRHEALKRGAVDADAAVLILQAYLQKKA